MNEIAAVVAQEEEEEKIEKEAVFEKTALSQPLPKSDQNKKSRGKRNSDALYSYIASMGKFNFPIFCAFTFGDERLG